MRTSIAAVLVSILALTLTACPREDSCNILTDGIYFALRVIEEDGEVIASAVFSVGNALGTELSLGNCGDDIAVNGTPLKERRGVFVSYEAVVAEADTYEFVFTRDGEGPYTCTVSPPPVVTPTAPAEGEIISRQDAFDITWEDNNSGGADINLYIYGPCITDILRNVGDNGLYTMNADELEMKGDEDTCDVNILFTRTLDGTMDPALDGFVRAKTLGRTWIESGP